MVILKEELVLAGAEPSNGSLPFQLISKYADFPTSDQESWWNSTGPLLCKVLESTNYTIDRQYQYLLFYSKVLIPALGPHPQQFQSAITRSGLPLEFSVNYQQRGGEPIARIGFEPMDFLSGTARDPYNQSTIAEMVIKLSKLNLQGFDPRLFNYFAHEHTVTKEERDRLQGSKVQGSDLKSQMAFGFDLKGGDVVTKGYSFPGLKTQASGRSFGELMTSSIRNLQGEMDCSEAFNAVNDYMEEVNGYNQFAFFSWDCVVPSKSRLKFYGVHNDVTWPKIEELWTLNGRAKRSADAKGLEYLQQLWKLMGINEGVKDFKGGFDDGKTIEETPMVWNYEMKPGNPLPYTKFYFPVHGENDLKVVTALAEFFNLLGWKDLAREYPRTVQSFYPDCDLSKTRRLVSWISFAYTEKTGVYLSVYYHSSLEYPWLSQEAETKS